MIIVVIKIIIKAYKFFISPLLGNNCRFYPSCSEYAQESLEKLGLFRGIYFIVKRLLRCHPFAKGGVDFVPNPNDKNSK